MTNDSWRLLRLTTETAPGDLPASDDIIVPCPYWLAYRDVLVTRPTRLGVWLSGEDEPRTIAEDLRLFAVIAVDFPKFTDGRGYSTARLLRERYGWRGELRAIGDVQRDQLFYLARCGFDACALREGEDPDSALRALDDFSDAYQTSVDRPVPLFRRRTAGHNGGHHARSA